SVSLWFPPAAAGGGKPEKVAEVEKATELFNQGKFDEALVQLKAAVKKKPTLPPPRLMLARFHLRAGQAQAAPPQLELAGGGAPGAPGVLRGRRRRGPGRGASARGAAGRPDGPEAGRRGGGGGGEEDRVPAPGRGGPGGGRGGAPRRGAPPPAPEGATGP